MADSIVVNLSELRSRIQDIRRDGSEYVRISISDPDEFDDEVIPSCLEFAGCKANETDIWTDYEDVEAVENAESLEEACIKAVHKSSNLF